MKKRGIFFNKKAQGDIESYFVMIKLIVAFGAIFAMSAYVYSVATDSFFHKLYFSRDIAFMTNAVYSAPGNVYMEYEREDLDKFAVDFDEQKVKLNEEDIKKKMPFSYYYAGDLNYGFEKEIIKNSNKIVFQKSPYVFEVADKLNPKLKLIKCKEIDTSDLAWENKFFLIDPGHGDGSGFSKGDIKEDVIVGSIGVSLYNKFRNTDITRENIGGNTEEQVRKDFNNVKELIERSDVIISLHMRNSLVNNNNIKIFVSSSGDEELVKKRERLGCLIINEFFSDEKLHNIFTGGNVIPKNPEYIEDDYKRMLDNDKIGIVVEIGNIQSEGIKELQNPEIIMGIAKNIYDGVRKYYE